MAASERAKAARDPTPSGRRERLRLAGAVAAGALITLFAVLNLDEVDVNWFVGTWSTPLIVVIVASALLGAGLDRGLQRRARKRARRG